VSDNDIGGRLVHSGPLDKVFSNTPEGFHALASALAGHPTLRTLRAARCQLRASGGIDVANLLLGTALRLSTTLSGTVSQRLVGHRSGQSRSGRAPAALEEVDLTGNDIGGYTVMTRFYKKELVRTPEGPRALVAALRQSPGAPSKPAVFLHPSKSLNEWVDILVAATSPWLMEVTDEARRDSTSAKRHRPDAADATVGAVGDFNHAGVLLATSAASKLEVRPTPHRFAQCLRAN
jgi:hypothetical protein